MQSENLLLIWIMAAGSFLSAFSSLIVFITEIWCLCGVSEAEAWSSEEAVPLCEAVDFHTHILLVDRSIHPIMAHLG